MMDATTKEELLLAGRSGAEWITVRGDLAEKLKKAESVAKIGGVGLLAILWVSNSARCMSSYVGGVPYFLFMPISLATGVKVSEIFDALSVGVSLISEIFRDYDIACFNGDCPGVTLRRKGGGTG